jgi:ubiquinone/menaquinone biosynthesis C-methylase UbiE
MEDIMASPIEEDFVYEAIKKLSIHSNILEFGCGQNTFPNKISKLGYKLTAIDLYERNNSLNKGFNFIKGDFSDIQFPSNYHDCIYALSSFEHIGIESNDIINENDALNKVCTITKKIKYLLKNNGLFLVTLPFGDYRYYYVDKNGKWSYNREKDSVWGAKVYDIKDIDNIFKDYILEERKFYLRIGKDFFYRYSWIETDYKKCYIKKEITDAIVCLKLKIKK